VTMPKVDETREIALASMLAAQKGTNPGRAAPAGAG
jgi:hypothetical protein